MCSGIARPFVGRPLALLVTFCLSVAMIALTGCGAAASSGAATQSNSNSQVSQARVGVKSVLTHLNDNYRDGLNQTETTLTPANVSPSTFGRVAIFPVQGYVYAEPLYVPNVAMPGAKRSNLLIVATEHDQLYAFDVDSKTLAWHVDFLASSSNASTLSQADVNGCHDIIPEIGITGTPVINATTGTIYLIVRTKEVVNGATVFYQRLHAVEIATGTEVMPPTVVTGPPSDYASTGMAKFDPVLNNQRAALLLAHNQVYVAWASHCDIGPYMGWLISFDQSTLQPTAYWTPVPYSVSGGIWLSGSGPSLDANGDIYVPVANGSDHEFIGPKGNYRDSLVRLHWSATDGFTVRDYFAPYNYTYMDDGDLDFGSSAALLLPEQTSAPRPHLLVVRDKTGMVYVLDRDDLGKWQANDNSQAVQTFQAGGDGLSSMLFWNSTLFIAGGFDIPRAYSFDPTTQQFDPAGKSFFNYPLDSRGSTPALSANGTDDAILWMITDFADGKHAVLHALDPNDISAELYSSNMLPDRDAAGLGVKFVVPTIADGLVSVGAQNEVDMYGLLTQ